MKVTEKGPSKWLSQYELATPLTAIIDDFKREQVKGNYGTDWCDILHFAGGAKPLILRAVTRKVVIAAYGDETDLWRGKPIEIYYDPNVQNSSSMGAIRVRIPVATPPTKPAGPPLGTEEQHRLAMSCFAGATTLERLEACMTRSKQIRWEHWQVEEQHGAYAARKRALTPAATTKQPAATARR